MPAGRTPRSLSSARSWYVPAIRDGEMVYVKPSPGESLHRGDIVLVKGNSGFRLHRLIQADVRRDVFITRGDSGLQDDPAVRPRRFWALP